MCRVLIVAFALLTLGLAPSPALADPAVCRFVLGFHTLQNAIPLIVGDCVTDEAHNPDNGDALQQTTRGLLVWRKADNFTAFTDGSRSWVNGPFGVQERPNTERFAWEANPDGLPRAATAITAPPAPGRAGPAALYPDPALTPGDVFPGATAREVCTPGYAASVRAVSSAERARVYARYGIANVPGTDEVDHFIPLELGGSNALANLWPEPYEPRPGAHEKDRVENYLHTQVCGGAMTLQQAQTAISTDWYAVYLTLP